jgi:hypothetical protein
MAGITPNPERIAGAMALIHESGILLRDGVRDAFPGDLVASPIKDLAAQYTLDRGLVWKLQRMLATHDPIRVVHESPSMPGLKKLLSSAKRVGTPEVRCETLARAIESYGTLIDAFPDGRQGLRAALTSHVPEAKHAADRDARRAMVQGAAHLRGFCADTVYNANVFFADPNDPNYVCRARTTGLFGFRRLREGSTFRLLATAMTASNVPGDTPGRGHFTLEGEASRSIDDYLFPEHTTEGASDLLLSIENDRCYLNCPPGVPEINMPVNLVVGLQSGRMGVRYAQDDIRYEFLAHVHRLPSSLSVLDLVVHRNVFPDLDPTQCTQSMTSDLDLKDIPSDPAALLDQLDQPFDTHDLGTGLGRAASGDVPAAAAIISTMLERMGMRAEDFRLYRYRQTYPVPECARIHWFTLPEAP